MEKGVPVRSISRCLAMLKFINSSGPVSLMEIAKAVALPYPTTIRIVQTLIHEGMIESEPVRKLYRATSTRNSRNPTRSLSRSAATRARD